jgi:hypothetical protein
LLAGLLREVASSAGSGGSTEVIVQYFIHTSHHTALVHPYHPFFFFSLPLSGLDDKNGTVLQLP